MEQQDDLPKLWNYSYKTVGTQNASQSYFGGIDKGPTRGAFQGAQSGPRENQNDLEKLCNYSYGKWHPEFPPDIISGGFGNGVTELSRAPKVVPVNTKMIPQNFTTIVTKLSTPSVLDSIVPQWQQTERSTTPGQKEAPQSKSVNTQITPLQQATHN